MNDRTHHRAIVTGHSRGLGAAITETLLERGIPVLGVSRTLDPKLPDRFPGLVEQVAVDLADADVLADWLGSDALRSWVAQCEVPLLVSNAGTLGPVGPLPTQDPAAIAKAVALNVAAPLMLAGAFAAASAAAADRRIVQVSSGAGRNAYPGWAVYCATKAALDHHARSVALDRTPGLRICSLAPGVVDTDMQAEIRATSVERFPNRERFVALKRDGALATPGDTGRRLVAYLLDARFGDQPVADLRG